MALKKELDLFEGRPLDIVSDSKQWEEVNPVTALTNNTNIIEFVIPESEFHTDLALSFLEVRGNIVKSDETDFDDNDEGVTFVNYPLASIFKDVTVYLKNEQISRTEHLYGYKAMLHLLINHDTTELESFYSCGGFQADTPGHANSADVAGDNAGVVARHAQFQNRVRLCGPVFNEMFIHQEKLLAPQVPIKLRFVRQSNGWLLMSNAANLNKYRFDISSMTLHVLRKHISPEITMSHEANALKYNATFKYPIVRQELTTFSITQHDTSFVKSNLFLGEVPDCIYIMMVRSDAFNGRQNQNPYNFEHFGLRSLDVRMNGRSVTGTPLEINLANDDAIRPIYLTYLASGRRMKWFDRNTFKGGYFILGIDLTPDHASYDLSHRKPKRQGNISLFGTFANPLQHNVEVIVAADYRSLIEIDQKRNVIQDL